MCWFSQTTLTEKDGVAVWLGKPPAGVPQGMNPLEALRKTVAHLKSPKIDGLPTLTGGLVGYMGYDAVRRLENIPTIAIDDLRLPEIAFMLTSDLAVKAAQAALASAGITSEDLDLIILATSTPDHLGGFPSTACVVQDKLGAHTACAAFDVQAVCAGFTYAIATADAFIRCGSYKKVLVIGAETLSRVVDDYDRDSMIFSDGAGACILEHSEDPNQGILSFSVQSHCNDEAYFLYLGKSYHPEADDATRYIKMKGRKVYEYAIKNVPIAMKACIEKAGVDIKEVKKFFLHQANEKMDEGFIKALYKLYDIKDIPADIMPMSIHELGNSSVATIPTLYDLVHKGKYPEHELEKGDVVIFASVGAGMNINAICYRL